jgi:hypothetical protein
MHISRGFAVVVALLAGHLISANPVELSETGVGVGIAVRAPPPAPPGQAPPPPCTPISPPPSESQTKDRFNQFANALLVKKDLNAAFRFVSANYVVSLAPVSMRLEARRTQFASILTCWTQNHHAGVGNGQVSAYKYLQNLNWSKANIQVKKLAFQDDESWLDYIYSGHGEVVDRFRWQAGCIVEHVRVLPTAGGKERVTDKVPAVGFGTEDPSRSL